MSDYVEIIKNSSALLWSVVGIIGAVILLWGLWQIIQIVRNLREYGLDYIGFMRGEIYAVAKKHKIDVMKPSQKRKRIHSIIWEERNKEDEKG